MKSLLLFLAGVLVGANVVYFLAVHEHRVPDCAPTSQVGAPTPPAQPSPVAPANDRGATPAPTGTAPASVPPSPPASAPTAAAPASIAGPSGLLLPVAGVQPAQLTDTFNQQRDGTRRHEALDIMAPRGTPVLAAADGKLVKLFTSVPGGLTLYEFDPTGTYAYYYAHLDRYAPGLAEGQSLKRGQVIGQVGSTGNASEDAPHLHFAIFLLGPEKQWWKGTPIDPFPLLTAQH
jgi:peptidoglycan LD-endopeptidase LytH